MARGKKSKKRKKSRAKAVSEPVEEVPAERASVAEAESSPKKARGKKASEAESRQASGEESADPGDSTDAVSGSDPSPEGRRAGSVASSKKKTSTKKPAAKETSAEKPPAMKASAKNPAAKKASGKSTAPKPKSSKKDPKKADQKAAPPGGPEERGSDDVVVDLDDLGFGRSGDRLIVAEGLTPPTAAEAASALRETAVEPGDDPGVALSDLDALPSGSEEPGDPVGAALELDEPPSEPEAVFDLDAALEVDERRTTGAEVEDSDPRADEPAVDERTIEDDAPAAVAEELDAGPADEQAVAADAEARYAREEEAATPEEEAATREEEAALAAVEIAPDPSRDEREAPGPAPSDTGEAPPEQAAAATAVVALPDLGEISTPEARARLLAETLAHAEMQEARYRVPTQDRRAGRVKATLALAILGIAGILAIAPPSVVTPEPPPALGDAEYTTGLLTALLLQAEQIEAFRVREHRLPASLDEVDARLPDVRYVRSGNRLYQLVAYTREGQAVIYDSAAPAPAFDGVKRAWRREGSS